MREHGRDLQCARGRAFSEAHAERHVHQGRRRLLMVISQRLHLRLLTTRRIHALSLGSARTGVLALHSTS